MRRYSRDRGVQPSTPAAFLSKTLAQRMLLLYREEGGHQLQTPFLNADRSVCCYSCHIFVHDS